MAKQSTGEARRDAAQALLTSVVRDLGLQLEDVVLTPAGSRRVLRVVVDVADEAVEQTAGLSLDTVAEAAHAISEALDASDVMGGAAYVLEVTSPGVDRPLTTPRHFRRNVRRKVLVTLADGSEVTGRVTAADDCLQLSVEGPKKGMTADRTLAWADVVRALVQVEFTHRDGPPTDQPDDDDTDDTDTDDTENED